MARGRVRYVPNPAMYREFASSDEMRSILLERAHAGANVAHGLAPSYSGPTWDPAVSRSGEYRQSIYSVITMTPSGWRASFGAAAPWALQVEFGTGAGRSNRDVRGRFRRMTPRPQHGWSPKFRPLGRALDALRI